MIWRIAVALGAIVAIAVGLLELRRESDGLHIARAQVGDTPVTIFQPAGRAPGPVIIIAHGFAGSQQLMQPFAETLARNGYTAITFDFLGHGRDAVPMRGDITEGETITSELTRQLAEVADYARTLPGSDGRLGVLGHSMASDIVVRFAQTDPAVAATVAVSVFSPVVTATAPRNLLVIVGALEPSMLKTRAFASSISPPAETPSPARPMAASPTALRGAWCWRAASSISACSIAATAWWNRCNG